MLSPQTYFGNIVQVLLRLQCRLPAQVGNLPLESITLLHPNNFCLESSKPSLKGADSCVMLVLVSDSLRVSL